MPPAKWSLESPAQRNAAIGNYHENFDRKLHCRRGGHRWVDERRIAFAGHRHGAKLQLSIDDFDRISSRVPILADLKPGGRFVATDFYAAGGTALVAKRLIEGGILRGECPTVTGKTIGEEAMPPKKRRTGSRPQAERAAETNGRTSDSQRQSSVRRLRRESRGTGCEKFRGTARVFDSEEAAFHAVEKSAIKAGDVVVIRYEGPKGGPGMREMLAVTAALVGAGLGDSVALLTDGRFSGATHGLDGRARRARSRKWRPHRRSRGRRHHYF